MKNKRLNCLHLKKAGKEVRPDTQKWLCSIEKEKEVTLAELKSALCAKGTGFSKSTDVWVTFKI